MGSDNGKLMKYVLTKKHRYEVCIHEAAHAVIYALGGHDVYSIEVAPVAVEEWVTQDRKGGQRSDLWGICRTSDPGVIWLFHWDKDKAGYVCDKQGYIDYLKSIQSQLGPRATHIARDSRRRLRAWICGSIAGPMADAIYVGDKTGEIWLEPEYTLGEDLTVAQAMSRFLPYGNEYDHLANITESVLREPEIWKMVLTLAGELEQTGCLNSDDRAETLQQHLPPCRKNWPSSGFLTRSAALKERRALRLA
jgi:hypothetical protein